MSQILQEVQVVAERVAWDDGLTADLFYGTARVEVCEVGAPDTYGHCVVVGKTARGEDGFHLFAFITLHNTPVVGSTVEVFGLFAECYDGYGYVYLDCIRAFDIDGERA